MFIDNCSSMATLERIGIHCIGFNFGCLFAVYEMDERGVLTQILPEGETGQITLTLIQFQNISIHVLAIVF